MASKRSLTKRPLNLNDIVDALHNINSDDDLPSEVTIFPPEDPNNEITDEDSCDEEFVTLHNLSEAYDYSGRLKFSQSDIDYPNKSKFTGELAESRATEVMIRDVDEQAMKQLVEFCYTAHIVLEESNLQALLPAACLLQLQEIQDVCCEFIKRQLTYNFIQRNFPEVMESLWNTSKR
ncbi:unnamed protein product [Parnassius apollo]|uniref:(apollo) hypothetical protein n=1 Tax=Parnassius apollo TaxID=110799 RepID=A0A8S3XXS3_PARAO|nr:unnamed protein product [Parnassius apollo]